MSKRDVKDVPTGATGGHTVNSYPSPTRVGDGTVLVRMSVCDNDSFAPRAALAWVADAGPIENNAD